MERSLHRPAVTVSHRSGTETKHWPLDRCPKCKSSRSISAVGTPGLCSVLGTVSARNNQQLWQECSYQNLFIARHCQLASRLVRAVAELQTECSGHFKADESLPSGCTNASYLQHCQYVLYTNDVGPSVGNNQVYSRNPEKECRNNGSDERRCHVQYQFNRCRTKQGCLCPSACQHSGHRAEYPWNGKCPVYIFGWSSARYQTRYTGSTSTSDRTFCRCTYPVIIQPSGRKSCRNGFGQLLL